MERISLDQSYLLIARVVSLRGTCSRLQVGGVLSREGRVVSTGYNGAPSKVQHCSHDGTEQHCRVAVHAERNVIGYAARFGVETDGGTLYLTHSPCWDCASILIAAGIERVVFEQEYGDQYGVEKLRESEVLVEQQEVR